MLKDPITELKSLICSQLDAKDVERKGRLFVFKHRRRKKEKRRQIQLVVDHFCEYYYEPGTRVSTKELKSISIQVSRHSDTPVTFKGTEKNKYCLTEKELNYEKIMDHIKHQADIAYEVAVKRELSDIKKEQVKHEYESMLLEYPMLEKKTWGDGRMVKDKGLEISLTSSGIYVSLHRELTRTEVEHILNLFTSDKIKEIKKNER